MAKRTTNRASLTAFVLLALGCGGRAEDQVSASVGGAAPAGGAPSIAVAGSSAGGSPKPAALPMDCPGGVAGTTFPPQLALLCKVGAPLQGEGKTS